MRLANRTCPLGWVAARGSADAALARRVFERCNDAEAVLALAPHREASALVELLAR